MEEGGIIRFEFYSNRVVITNQGQRVGEIEGKDFSRVFCSMWFGSQPVMEEIKVGLLNNKAGLEEENKETFAQGGAQEEQQDATKASTCAMPLSFQEGSAT